VKRKTRRGARTAAQHVPAPLPKPRPASQPFTERVYAMVRQVPYGRVVSYGGIAALLGQPRAARGVGGALSALDDYGADNTSPGDSDVPWWRVVNRNGQISIQGGLHGGALLQRALLEAEGVQFEHDRIDWKRFGWVPDETVGTDED
jgi:methylated-DNA-protein-cysteine methyltransferase-like protein